MKRRSLQERMESLSRPAQQRVREMARVMMGHCDVSDDFIDADEMAARVTFSIKPAEYRLASYLWACMANWRFKAAEAQRKRARPTHLRLVK